MEELAYSAIKRLIPQFFGMVIASTILVFNRHYGLISFYQSHSFRQTDAWVLFRLSRPYSPKYMGQNEQGRLRLYSDSELILSMANNLYYFRNYEIAGKLYERAE